MSAALAVLTACGSSDSPADTVSTPQATSTRTIASQSTPTSVSATAATETVTGNEQRPLAPDFTLPNANGPEVTLSELSAEQPVILVFYRAFW